MSDKEFLHWLILRIIKVYRENPNVDFVQRLKKIADKLYEDTSFDKGNKDE